MDYILNLSSLLTLIFVFFIFALLIISSLSLRKRIKLLIQERKRYNNLTTIYLIDSIKKQLQSEDNIQIHEQLSRIDQTYIVPDIDKASSPEEVELLQKEKEKLDYYLSLIEMCSLLLQNGNIRWDQIHLVVGDRIEDIKSHDELYDLIQENKLVRRDLWWIMR